MNKKIIIWFIINYNSLISYIFWFYFLFIGFYNIFSERIDKYLLFVFFFLLGLYLGNCFTKKVTQIKKKYLKENNNKQEPFNS